MKILMKSGTLIDIKEDKEIAWISIDEKRREIVVNKKGSNTVRMIIMMENVDLIDFDNGEQTGIDIKVFPGN